MACKSGERVENKRILYGSSFQSLIVGVKKIHVRGCFLGHEMQGCPDSLEDKNFLVVNIVQAYQLNTEVLIHKLSYKITKACVFYVEL